MKKLILATICLSAPLIASASQMVVQPSFQAVNKAISGYNFALSKNKVTNNKYLAIVDYTLPSDKKRFFIYDLKQHKAIYSTLVAHGKGSGTGPYAKHFSNRFHTHMSSLGTFVTTGANYPSHHGHSIHVEGLNPALNGNAGPRQVEIHSAWYVNPTFAARHHRVGNSYGCFAVSKTALQVIKSDVGNGSVVYAYYA
jgi:hypothetical protein